MECPGVVQRDNESALRPGPNENLPLAMLAAAGNTTMWAVPSVVLLISTSRVIRLPGASRSTMYARPSGSTDEAEAPAMSRMPMPPALIGVDAAIAAVGTTKLAASRVNPATKPHALIVLVPRT
jgi:hypothetical protein